VLLQQFNTATADEVDSALRACCDIPSWVEELRVGRPYADRNALLDRADRSARRWTRAEVERALAAHPRIGERASGDGREAAWSREEQSGVDQAAAELAAGNRAYEARFGRVFLVRAAGRSTAEVLDALRTRLSHDDETEAAVVAEELRDIALLRLGKAVES